MALKLLLKVYVKDTIQANDEIVIRVELARLDEKERYRRGGSRNDDIAARTLGGSVVVLLLWRLSTIFLV